MEPPRSSTPLRRTWSPVLAAALLPIIWPLPQAAAAPDAAANRAAVSIRSGDGNYVSWRLLGSDPAGTGFTVHRDGIEITPAPVTGSTGFFDAGAPAGARYAVVPSAPEVAATPAPARPFDADHLDVPLSVPDGGTTPDGTGYTYSANDVSVGDLDGDGEYDDEDELEDTPQVSHAVASSSAYLSKRAVRIHDVLDDLRVDQMTVQVKDEEDSVCIITFDIYPYQVYVAGL